MSDQQPGDQQPGDQQPGDEGILQSLPGGMRWLPVAGFVVIVVLFETLAPDVFSGESGALGVWGYAAVLGVVLVGLLVLVALADLNRLGGVRQATLFRTAMRQGRIPDGADRATWAVEVPRRLEATRRSRGFDLRRAARVPVVGVLALAATLASDAPALAVLVAVGLTAAGAGLLVHAWRSHDRRVAQLQALAEQL